MKSPEAERLVNDLLRDESYVAFRAGLYQDTLAELRRHRGRRRRLALLALAACLPLALCIYWLLGPHASGSKARQSAVVMVRSVPLTPGQVVTTADYLRDTAASRREHVQLAIKASRVEIVHTPQAGAPEFLSDQELLALFKGRPIALIHAGPGAKHLILLDAEGQPEF